MTDTIANTAPILQVLQSINQNLGQIYLALTAMTGKANTFYNASGVVSGAAIKSASGTLLRVIINKSGASTAVSLYDAASAINPIAVLGVPSGNMPVSINYNIAFSTGLYIVTEDASTNVTVVYE